MPSKHELWESFVIYIRSQLIRWYGYAPAIFVVRVVVSSLSYVASSPRFQRYVSKRAKKQVAEDPDPFSTHQVGDDTRVTAAAKRARR